jgi:hypothetical protein
MLAELSRTREESLPQRRLVFRELQRKLHPDKCAAAAAGDAKAAAAANEAFQHLMAQRASYLS